MFRGIHPSILDQLSDAQLADILLHEDDNTVYTGNSIHDSDQFRMYTFKIRRCTKTKSHDWTECPYAHRGEKARRRDPCKYNYAGIACTEYRTGECKKGELCEFAHGIFEFWLHPTRYRTRFCNAGMFCRRKVCFFAHSVQQLRPEAKYVSKYSCYARQFNAPNGIIGESSSGRGQRTVPRPLELMRNGSYPLELLRNESCPHELLRNESYPHELMRNESCPELMRNERYHLGLMRNESIPLREDWDFLETLRALKINEENYHNHEVPVDRNFSRDEADLTPDIGWVSELVS